MFLSSTLSFLDSFSIVSATVGVFLIVSFEYYKRKILSSEDKEVIKKLLQTLDVDNFQENIYQQNAWYGYSLESIQKTTSFVKESERISNFIAQKKSRRSVEKIRTLLKEFNQLVIEKMNTKRTSYILPKEPDKYSQSEATAIVLNEKTKRIFQELEKFVFYIKKEYQLIF